MAKVDPVKLMLDCMEDLLRFAQERTKEPLTKPLDPSIIKGVDRLEKMVEQYHELSINLFQEQKVDPRNLLITYKKHPENLTKRQRRIVEKGLSLMLDTAVMRKAIQKVREDARIGGSEKKKKQRKILKRKKRFKKMGGDTWMKL